MNRRGFMPRSISEVLSTTASHPQIQDGFRSHCPAGAKCVCADELNLKGRVTPGDGMWCYDLWRAPEQTNILVIANSGYNTYKWRVELVWRDDEYRPPMPQHPHSVPVPRFLSPGGDSFTDGGPYPYAWRYPDFTPGVVP